MAGVTWWWPMPGTEYVMRMVGTDLPYAWGQLTKRGWECGIVYPAGRMDMERPDQVLQSLPEYKCHKVVRASKILRSSRHGDERYDLELNDTPVLVGVSIDWAEQHEVEPGGYLVVYSDGYMSYSPAKAFEEGYTRLQTVELQLEQEPILKYFHYAHLPPTLQEVSKGFAVLASALMRLPRSAERTVALRKLLEGKDAAVRAALPESQK